MFEVKRVGGLTFIKAGQLTVSFSFTRTRAAIFQPGDVAKVAAMYVGAMIPLIVNLI